ncbi:galactokinase [Scheffersomyces amazonensis]|uniref:galactokinase n=1 Tax=Scheffersomyces amazonensis TaxID=1078765 RepID=UPI00315D358E
MTIEDPIVPTFESLSFSSNPQLLESRIKKLIEKFTINFKDEPEFISRSPGRVNLIGDHIDYNFFPVLPMAIDVDVIGVGKSYPDSLEVQLINTDEAFTPQTFVLPADGSVIEIDSENESFSWASYFKCGLIVAHKYILENHAHLLDSGKKPLNGLKVAFDGTVPTGGGLSSSAAFCVASTLAILKANNVPQISKKDLTRITVVCEHYVGVNTGGMDQCASIYGEASKALLVKFKPNLIGVPFKFPSISDSEELAFLITNSLQKSNKHETAPIHYNLRVVEMGIGADLLAHKFGLTLPKDSNIKSGSLRGFLDSYYTDVLHEKPWDGNDVDVGVARLEQVLKLIEKPEIFTAEEKVGFSVDHASQVLGITSQQFTETYLTKVPVRFEVLKLYQRVKHVYAESLKVLQSLRELEKANANNEGEKFLTAFGKIMNESQTSLDELNNSSNEKLNEICAIALANGSYGSRITGAGWGGSIVHLTTTKKLPGLIEALTEKYYKAEFPGITEEELKEAIVDSKPATGSCYIKIDGKWL